MASPPPDVPASPPPDAPASPAARRQRNGDDRRTLIIGLLAMVGLVVVGLIAAQLFGRPACTLLDATPLPARAVGAEVGEVLEEVLGAEDAAGVLAALAPIAEDVGRPVGAAEVTGANSLTTNRDGVVALGRVTTSLGAELTRVRATADVGPARVVGSGNPMYQLVLPNEVTGQIDALQPLTTDLDGLTCVDTAVVGSPLAFLLDAGAGELLLYRAQDDGGDDELELRDPVEGRVWRTPLQLPPAPPGTTASRLEGALGPGTAVASRPIRRGQAEPAVVAVDRSSGQQRWTVATDAVFDALDPRFAAGSLAPSALAIGEAYVLVALRSGIDAPLSGADGQDPAAPQDAEGDVVLLGLAREDGSIRFALTDEALSPDVSASEIRGLVASGNRAAVALRRGELVHLLDVEVVDGEPVILATAEVDGRLRGLARDERRVVAGAGGSVVVMDDEVVVVAELGVPVLDVAIAPTGAVVLLLGDEQRAVAVALRS